MKVAGNANTPARMPAKSQKRKYFQTVCLKSFCGSRTCNLLIATVISIVFRKILIRIPNTRIIIFRKFAGIGLEISSNILFYVKDKSNKD